MTEHVRWKARYSVLSILFLVNVVSFADRMVMAVAVPFIAIDFHLTTLAMGVVLSAFYATYSLSQIPGGLLADRFGARRVATLAMLWWSLFTAVTGAAANLTQMLVARLGFGLGEGIYPACSFKTVATWFPKAERATATAILLACSALGAALAPLIAVKLVSLYGWRSVFFALSLPGVLTASLFYLFVPDRPADHRRIAPAELREIEEGALTTSALPATKPSFLSLLSEPNIAKCFVVLFAFDLAYWGFSTWLPTYLLKARGFSPAEMGVAASLPSFAGILGCILGGAVSERFFRGNRQLPIITAELMSALLLFFMFRSTSTMALITFQTSAGFCLYFFFGAFWALPMTTISREVMGAASGLINMAGQLAAFVSPIIVGYLVGVGRGSFASTFVFLILSLLVSAAVVLALPRSRPPIA